MPRKLAPRVDVRCLATTNNGTRCKHKRLIDEKGIRPFCKLHDEHLKKEKT